MINIALSSDIRGFATNSTLIASIIRRTALPVHVRYWCRGFQPESFEIDSLKVEFKTAEADIGGRYPGHVPDAVFDRLRVIEECEDWSRCLIMDHDMICTADLAEYFEEDFEGNLLMGRLFGPGNTIGLQMHRRGGLPPEWKHCEAYPFFYMGPMMNLEAMRNENIWSILLRAHAGIGQDEQISLTAACGGRVKGVNKKWNLVPQWDGFEEQDFNRRNIPLHNGIPCGVIHWTGRSKPWHRPSRVWRSDIWEAEKTNWEQLRAGEWTKPYALLLNCDPQDASGLAVRGWRVDCVKRSDDSEATNRIDELAQLLPPREFPDVVMHEPLSASSLLSKVKEEARFVKFGEVAEGLAFIRTGASKHLCVVIQGPAVIGRTLRSCQDSNLKKSIISRSQWSKGGPDPYVLEFTPLDEDVDIPEGYECYITQAWDMAE